MQDITITVLGCGSSLGVPQIGCECYVCTSTNPKNARTRVSILIESANTKVLIDTSPDFRRQALACNMDKLDAVIITHHHSDHIAGLDDVKPFYLLNGRKQLPVYMQKQTWDNIQKGFYYLFENTGSKLYAPILTKNIVEDYQQLTIGDINLQLFPQQHGELISLGVRVNDFVYSTDVNSFPENSKKYLQDMKVWLVGCHKYICTPTHPNYEQMLDWVDCYKPEKVFLTHLAHEMDYDELCKLLPENIRPSYDGLKINI